jgi:hypothetical protein
MSTSETGSRFGSNAPWPPATITVRERRSPASVWRVTTSSSQEIRSAVVSSRISGANGAICSCSWSTRSLARIFGCPGTSKIHFSG